MVSVNTVKRRGLDFPSASIFKVLNYVCCDPAIVQANGRNKWPLLQKSQNMPSMSFQVVWPLTLTFDHLKKIRGYNTIVHRVVIVTMTDLLKDIAPPVLALSHKFSENKRKSD